MPNIMNQELVRAFNIILCHNEVAITNLTVQSTDQTFFKKEDRIVISFDKNMDVGQCMEYLHNIKESIVETFFGSESGANMSFNTKFFPFNFNERQLTKDKEGYKFLVPIDKGVVFNLKCLLAHGLAKDAKEDMGNEFGESCMEGRVCDVSFDRKSYLYCMQFYDKRLQDYFVESFSSRIKNYKNGPKKTDGFLKIKGNYVYIKESIFNNAEFIKDIVKHKASLECRDFEVTSAEDETVESLKFPVIDLLRKVGIPINSVLHVSYTGSGENSVLIPATKEVIGNIIYYKILSKEEVNYVNRAFGMNVLRNVQDCTSPKHLPVLGNKGMYGIDFSDQEISYCVLNKIMESSVINERHELAIDPELVRALSPVQSPVRVPNGPSSSLTGTSTQGFPTQSQGGALKDSPRQGSEKEALYNHVNPDGPSKGFLPPTQLSFPTVSCGVPVPSSSLQSVGAAQNARAGTSAWTQPIGAWSLPAPSAEPSLWQPSRPSSSKGANPVGTNPWAQQTNRWSLPAPSAEPSLWQPSRPSSWKGASERRTSDKPLTEEEKELFKALLYAFNLNNQILECHHTNFIVENGKIASFINDGVNVKEYLQKVIDKTKKEYCVNKKKAYDLNEFPFKFLSNCEKNQETTVIANISRGALFNLKKLFIQEHEKKVEIEDIDINIVEKAVKSKKDEWVDSQVKGGMARPREAITTCYPDESELEHIPIIKDKGGYCLDRTYENWEVESFLEERRCAKGTSKAKKMKSEDNKDSGYSSGFVTDAENVSSKAEATTSGYEFMDCENTGGGSPKRTLELSMGMEELAISTDLDATKVEQHSPIKKFRSN